MWWKRLPWWKKTPLVIGVVIVAIFAWAVVYAIANPQPPSPSSPSPSHTVAAVAATSATPTHTPTPTPSRTPTPTPTPTPSKTPTPTPTTQPAAPSSVAFATVTKSGTGDDVVKLPVDQPLVADISCPACQGNFSVKTDGTGTDDSLPVNTIGAYTGRHIVGAQNGSTIATWTISADSAWTITLSDLSVLKRYSGEASGTGDDAFWVTGTPTAAAITNQGKGNFVVESYGADDPLAVNEIGNYTGTVPIAAGVIQITSDGSWTLTPQ